MKAKLTVIFVIIAILCVGLVFNFKKVEHVFSGPVDVQQEGPKEVDLAQMDSFLKSSSWVDYSGGKVASPPQLFDASRPVYVHLWASWCAPCLNEIPELIAFAKRNKDRAYFVLVSVDDSKEDLVKFLKSFPEMNGPLFFRIWDQNKKLSKFVDADRLPMTVVLDRKEGKLKSIRSVIDWKNL